MKKWTQRARGRNVWGSPCGSAGQRQPQGFCLITSNTRCLKGKRKKKNPKKQTLHVSPAVQLDIVFTLIIPEWRLDGKDKDEKEDTALCE